ncbi:MAG: tetratricopeptide repeat protein, partial [Deltaproteobacteria bacterium]|nr:tetratricopeptide repeat protein [Kofleriaceae bacterium]
PRPATPSPAPPSRPATDTQLERALALAQQQKWPEARAAFVELATRHHGDPRYRAYVHYARGWEAFALGKDGEARAEWQRALACDPRNDLAKWALESTGVVK